MLRYSDRSVRGRRAVALPADVTLVPCRRFVQQTHASRTTIVATIIARPPRVYTHLIILPLRIPTTRTTEIEFTVAETGTERP